MQRASRGRSSLRIVARDVAALQILLSAVPALSALAAVMFGEYYSALGFVLSAAAAAGIGYIAYRACRGGGEPRGYHAMLIAGAGWLTAAVFGALPFFLIAHITPDAVAQSFVPTGETYASSLATYRNPLHALFDSMSCYTTTGLTMAVHEPSIGASLAIYRSLSSWVGGAGMIVLALAIIPRPGGVAGVEVYRSEAAITKLRPTIIGTARAIWKLYVLFTLVVFVYLLVAVLAIQPERGVQAAVFEAVNHAMAGVATGGISPLDDGIAEYGSPFLEMVHVVPMTVGMVALPLLYVSVRDRGLVVARRDPQFRMMIGILVVGLPLIVWLLSYGPIDAPIREGVFQFVSALSTSGWQTSNVAAWNDAAIVVLVLGAMIVGGAAGSTTGGIKLIRAYVLFRAVTWRIRKVFLASEAVVPFQIGDRVVPARDIQREIADAAEFTILYIFILAIGVLVTAHYAGPEHSLADSLLESAAAQTGAGLSTGITSPDMPIALEITYILQMWIGRLEIFPVVILAWALIARPWRRVKGASDFVRDRRRRG